MMLLEGRKILIVEDNVLNRAVYQLVLGSYGASLEFDRWGREALVRLTRSKRCDLVILDLMLDRFKSGFDVFREIRALPQFASVPILAVSASDPGEAIPKTREMGFSGFISKPINEERFAHQVLAVIAGEAIWHDGNLRV
jgi:CheY-like chemotaxis protein